MDTEARKGQDRKVQVIWDAEGLRCDPEELGIDSRCGDKVFWDLQCTRRDARIAAIVFDDREDPRGPFGHLAAENAKRWLGKDSRGAAYGRFKYTVVVEDGATRLELDPYILDTDRPW